MQTAPQICVFIPQLTQPLKTWKHDFGFNPKSPVFSELLQTFYSTRTPVSGLEQSLFYYLGLPPGDELPVAVYRYHCAEKAEITDSMLVCADPVHCEVGIKDVTLTHKIDDLDSGEADELISELNHHFAQDGLRFFHGGGKSGGKYWYLELPVKEPVKTTPLDDVFHKNIFPFLPDTEYRNWQSIHNEAQMLLHGSRLNQTREMAGQATVNSLWFWGGGLDFTATQSVQLVIGGEMTGQYIATASNSRWQELPQSGADLIALISQYSAPTANNEMKNGSPEVVIILDQLNDVALRDDIGAWQQQLSLLENRYIKPLQHAWEQGLIGLKFDSCSGQHFTPVDISGLSLWKKMLNKLGPNKMNRKKGVSLLDFTP